MRTCRPRPWTLDAAAKVGADGQGDYGIYGRPRVHDAQLHGMGVNLLNSDKTAFDFADNEAAINVTRLSELYAWRAIPKDC